MGEAEGPRPQVPGAPAVTVVVPVKDDDGLLAGCLDALDRQDYPGPVEVLVVDNGSAVPPSAVVAAHPRARLLSEPRGGSYAARNAGVAAASGEVLAFTDADCTPDPGWLSAAVARLLAAPDVGLVAGDVQVVLPAGRRPRTVELFELLHAFPQASYVAEHRFGVTANVVTRRAVLERVGPFAADLRSGGDKEWGNRVHAAGLRVVHAPEAVVRHPPRPTWAAYRTKLERVFTGELDARAARGEGPGDVGRVTPGRLVPPLSALRRAATDPRLPGPLARVGYVAGVWRARWLGVLVGARVRRRHAGLGGRTA